MQHLIVAHEEAAPFADLGHRVLAEHFDHPSGDIIGHPVDRESQPRIRRVLFVLRVLFALDTMPISRVAPYLLLSRLPDLLRLSLPLELLSLAGDLL